MNLEQVANQLNAKVYILRDRSALAVCVDFKPSMVKYQNHVYTTTDGVKNALFLVETNGVKVTDTRTKKHVVRYAADGDYSLIVNWDNETSHKDEMQKTVSILAGLLSDEKVKFIDHAKQYAAKYKMPELKTTEQAEDIFNNALSILAERVSNKGMNVDTLEVLRISEGVRANRIQLRLTDKKGKCFDARVIIASGPFKKPHYRYIFS